MKVSQSSDRGNKEGKRFLNIMDVRECQTMCRKLTQLMAARVGVLALDDNIVVVGVELLTASPPGTLDFLLAAIGNSFDIACQIRGSRVDLVAILQTHWLAYGTMWKEEEWKTGWRSNSHHCRARQSVQ
jgi:hypothetical protein